MDPACASTTSGPLILRPLLIAGALITSVIYCGASTPTQSESQETLATAQKFLAQERWQDVVRLVETTADRSPELNYDYGMALAHLERWDDARRAFLAARRKQPNDKRFPIELAGIAFKQKKYSESAAYLRSALRLDPKDVYANDFLATVYFLEGNLEAALKYWNRIGKPAIQEVHTPATVRINPILLDHAFAFAPASILTRDQWLTTEARLNALGIFSTYRLDLLARPDEKFDAQFVAQEQNGFGSNTLQSLLTVFRGLPYQEVNPEYFNIGGSATNFFSMLRWDAEKRRGFASLSGPFRRNLKWIYEIHADLRNENWAIRRSFTGTALTLAAFNLRREEFAAEIMRLVGWRLSWSLGAEFSHRDFRNVFPEAALSTTLLSQGYQLAQNASLNYQLWRVPERRITVTSQALSKIVRFWPAAAASQPETFGNLQAAVRAQWLPRPRGDDYETQWNIRAGNIFGQFPFDELFMLGMERDNDLWLRGHIGTRDGIKGSAPLGRRYFLSNYETDKNIYSNGIFTVKLGPFLDTGKIGGASSVLAANQWLWDTGVECKISVFGVGVSLIYGKDLRSGNNAFYTTVGR